MPGLNPGLRNSVSDPGFMSVSALLRQPFSPSNRVARYIYSQHCCYHTNIHSSSTGTPTHSPGEETLQLSSKLMEGSDQVKKFL